ncbi:MAG: riboflavin biosynthesis protein RibF, partial [Bacteroides sp.]|nr:riboflavin biosynthesis protein RibF [Bacteroides sp.]
VNTNPDDVTIEAHIFGLDTEIYSRKVELEFVSRMRSERRFASLAELQKQLAADASQALEILNIDKN